MSMTETRLSNVGDVERPSWKLSERLAGWIQFPREHGAWGMLLFPFISATVLTGAWSWNFIPASFAALAVFLIREPLAVLARQEYVWTNEHPEAGVARRSARMLSIVLLLSGIWLLRTLPLGWMAVLVLAAGAMTAAYVFAAVRNRQRSVLLQIIGAAALCGSAFLGYLAGARLPDETLLLLWSVHVLTNTGSVLTVHCLLDARRARKSGNTDSRRRNAAVAWHFLQLAVAALLLFTGRPWLGAMLLLPWIVHVADLARLDKSPYFHRPLRTLGFRELGISLCFSGAVIVALS